MDESHRPSVAAYAERAKMYEQAGDVQAAMRSYLIATHLQMLVLNPRDSATCFQLGLAFAQAGEDGHASAAFRAALALQPAHAEAWNNLGVLGDVSGPLRHAVRLSPGRADYHSNLAHALLCAGETAEGFREWEWRPLSPPRDFVQPRWDGTPFPDKTLLIHAEQGFGDCIQFCRYLPEAARLGGKIIVEMRPALAWLIGRVAGVAEIVLPGAPLPDFDLQLPLPSLAHLFYRPESPRPYLIAHTGRMEAWREKFPQSEKRKVGLIWAGNAAGDKQRALPFARVEALVRNFPDIAFFSLQREDEENLPGLTKLGAQLADFDDVAAALASLDLLISVDTAAAHLAGALGHDVRVLLHKGADWRWTDEWYPRARTYRQETAGDWDEVMIRVGADLRRP